MSGVKLFVVTMAIRLNLLNTNTYLLISKKRNLHKISDIFERERLGLMCRLICVPCFSAASQSPINHVPLFYSFKSLHTDVGRISGHRRSVEAIPGRDQKDNFFNIISLMCFF